MVDHNQHSTIERFTRAHPCPICNGYDNMPRGVGRRCAGFRSSDGRAIHCQRAELAGTLPLIVSSSTYAHRAQGPCRCGAEHSPAEQGGHGEVVSHTVATYDYCDAGGALLFQVLRRAPKAFRQRRPDGAGCWAWNLQGITPVLYRLPDLTKRASETVYLAEGEKDVDALHQLGLLATCNPMGAGKWRKDYSETLRGRDVVLLVDADDPGRRHGAQVAKTLDGVAASVRVIDLACERADGYDVSDWLAQGHTRVELEALVAAAPRAGGATLVRTMPQIMTARELLTRAFPEPRWAVDGLIPEGLTLLVGAPKIGKSWLMLDLLSSVAAGGKALDYAACTPGPALYLALEDGERLLQRRMQRIGLERGADQLHIATSWRRMDDGGREDLDAWLTAHPDCRLVVIDTLARIRPREQPGGGVYRQDYEALAPLADLARMHSCAIVVVHHTRKMQSEDVLDLVSGSNGLAGSVDAILVLQRARLGDDGILTIMGRDLEEQALAAAFDKDTCRWRIEGEASAVQISQMQREILETLTDEGIGLRASDIADRLGRQNDSSLRHVLCKMVKEGVLERTLRGVYNAAKGALAKIRGKTPPAADVNVIGCDRRDRGDHETQANEPGRWDTAAMPEARQQTPRSLNGATADHKRSQAITTPHPDRCPRCTRPYEEMRSSYNPLLFICPHCYEELREEPF